MTLRERILEAYNNAVKNNATLYSKLLQEELSYKEAGILEIAEDMQTYCSDLENEHISNITNILMQLFVEGKL